MIWKILSLSCLLLSSISALELCESTEVEELVLRLEAYPEKELKKMQKACREIKKWNALLDLTKSSITGELFKGEIDAFKEKTRYPKGDVFDQRTYSKYFYHAHREGEHGHFHLFVYERGMDQSIKPAKFDEQRHVAHLAAISMDEYGFPKGVFTINQWVTNEAWYSAKDTCQLLPKFKIKHTQPSFTLNRWVTLMVLAFRPQIEDVLIKRDASIEKWQELNPGKDAYKEKSLEVLSSCEISLEKQAYALKLAIERKQAL